MTAKTNRLPLDDEPNGETPDMPPNDDAASEDEVGAGEADTTSDSVRDAEDAEDHNCTEEFKPAVAVQGEFLVRIGDLGDWEYHLRRFSPLKTSHASALALTASDPLYLRPIVVLEKDGRFVVVDGRYILAAVKARHPGDDSVMVRAVRFAGSEGEAVAAMCDTALGSAVATRMEMAHGLLALQRANRISQTALAERYASLNKDKVSNMLIAARLQEAYPVFYELLEEPHKAPVSLGVALNKAVKTMPPADFADMLDRAHALAEEGERCGPGELLDLLQIPGQAGSRSAAAAGAEIEPSEDREAIFGADDQPVGAVEQIEGGGEKLSLPSPAVVSTMSVDEREAAAEGFIVHIRRYFGLDAQD